MTTPTRAQGDLQPVRHTLQPRWFKRFKMQL